MKEHFKYIPRHELPLQANSSSKLRTILNIQKVHPCTQQSMKCLRIYLQYETSDPG